mmetsp:Transcript_9284/g.18607  ORF Transcript_9284/g.18607 Transcript_9284/m.18607 type:complete len:228 (+) Transcript_9284:139-822(+)
MSKRVTTMTRALFISFFLFSTVIAWSPNVVRVGYLIRKQLTPFNTPLTPFKKPFMTPFTTPTTFYSTPTTLELYSSSDDEDKSSSPPSDEPPSLITTSSPPDLSAAESMFLSQQSWTSVSKANNEKAKAKMLEEVRLQELADEERRAKKGESPDAENYGPGSLSDLGSGALDDGAWESSKGDKDSEAELGLMLLDDGGEKEAKEQSDDDGMGLILGGEDPNPGGLIF